ncbi:branched-chain-amino-acid transaminase [Candidatus Kaiserbacteria bacterium CG10_big_fil_rev_8_21_14_0_10_56_12]|uniref:Branched-chain-amino-acid aminotransferase n=1 Tax=Candidatus Kaiserbacteria bacterium CG10_big_fil_rev_8_21_14_0_10_56_12 TaxID=1974611 RepID=A0A2H0UAK8_9BACT|nr:MAG: branched-chain-amino-acid transaminase [Candidatus Kaiserbacteria bacterium CG10_big_fil_rev_8_21_14_0_10_56_12]
MARIYPKAFLGNKIVPLKQASLGVATSAVLYGLSVYTVFPVSMTKKGPAAFRLTDHLTRLRNSARIIGIDTFEKRWGLTAFEKAVAATVRANRIREDVFVRATVHVSAQLPGTRSRGLETTLSIFVYEATPILPTRGARVKTSVWRRIPDYAIPSRAKVNGAYVNSVLAKQDALDSGYDDCIFLDVAGHVCELSAANIFIVRDGTLITPGASSDILEGITRRTVLELATDFGLPVVERTIDLTELYVADEVFASGTSAFVAPISEVDARQIGDGASGPVTKRLREAHRHVLHGESTQYEAFLTYLVKK